MSDTRHPHPSQPRVKCAVPQCNKGVPEALVMCGSHWKKAPSYIRRGYWKHQGDARALVESWARAEMAGSS